MPLRGSKFYKFWFRLQRDIEVFTSPFPNPRSGLSSRHSSLKSHPWKSSTCTNSTCHLSHGRKEMKFQMLSRLWSLVLTLFWPFHYSLFWQTGHGRPLLQVGCALRAGRAELLTNRHTTNYWKGQNLQLHLNHSPVYASQLSQKLAPL